VSGTELTWIERDDFAVAETVGLTLDKGERLTAAAQAEIVRVQVAAMGERFRWCEHCGAKLWSKGYYRVLVHVWTAPWMQEKKREF